MLEQSIAPRSPQTARTWAEINLEQIKRNVRAIRQETSATPNATSLMAIVKADAYGHGAVPVARACAHAGVEHFGVACLSEAALLRAAGITGEVYTLSPFLPHEADEIVRLDLIPMVSSREQWEALARASAHSPRPARFFLKVDTGMGRSGLLSPDARALWRIAQEGPANLRAVGIATHFSCADEPGGLATTQNQAAVFARFVDSLGDRDKEGVWLSLANSPAALLRGLPHSAALPQGARGFLVRAGLLVYGIEPFRGAFASSHHPDLQPALAWRARILLVRDLPAGATIGYGQTHTLLRPSRIATVAAGYADGLSRALSNNGHVLVRGQRFPLVGRVSMDQCQIDVTSSGASSGAAVRVNDVATLIGADGPETQTVLDLAERAQTTPHHPTCALSARVARVYVPSESCEL